LAILIGEQPQVMSVSWADDPPFFVVFMSEFRPGIDDDAFPGEPVCLHCLVEDGDEQLGRGLDQAKVHGRVDFDVDAGEWFVPDDAGWAQAGMTHMGPASS
jgi:hypothetical protein